MNLADIENLKRRVTTENGDLLHQLQELQNAANLLLKTKAALVASLDEQKCVASKFLKFLIDRTYSYLILSYRS